MTERERGIGQRVREVRVSLRAMQPEFARVLGLTVDRLHNVERGHTPLRADAALKLCERFNVCPRWLAEGAAPMWGNVQSGPFLLAKIASRSLFSSAYDAVLKGPVEAALAESMGWAVKDLQWEAAGKSPADAAAYWCQQLQRVWFERMTLEEQEALFRWLMGAAAQFDQNRRQGGWERISSQWSGFGCLTHVTESANVSPVKSKPLLPSLLEELRAATAERGMRTRLAEFLKVPLSNVSQWLSGEREPGGEYVLQMRRWLDLQRGKGR